MLNLLMSSITVFILNPITSFANDNNTTPLRFNTEGVPLKQGDNNFTFKVPSESSSSTDQTADPIENTPNDSVFKTYLDFPKHQLALRWNLSTFAGKFSYQGTDFNFVSNSLAGAQLAYKFIVDPELFFDADYTFYSASTKSGTANSFNVKDSTKSVSQLSLRGNYCWIGKNAFSKTCPGFEIYSDQYPVLGFANNTTLEMQSASDLMLGLNVHAQVPLIRSLMLNGRLGYLAGTGSGQSGALTSKKNTVIYLDSKLDWPLSPTRTLDFGLRYENRSSSIEGQVSPSIKDKWDTTAGNIQYRVGYIWEL